MFVDPMSTSTGDVLSDLMEASEVPNDALALPLEVEVAWSR